MSTAIKGALAELAIRWPVGTLVRHTSGWTGTISTVGHEPLGIAQDGAHCLLTKPVAGEALGAIRVARFEGGRTVVGWFAPRVLKRIEQAPAVVRRQTGRAA